jgi:hypothetical protein
MTERKTGFLGRYGGFVWGGAAALLLLLLVASFVLPGSSVSGAEREAQEHAESLASSVVDAQLTPDLLTRDIHGTDRRDLTLRVQAGILSDDRFEVVRIWRLDGGLIYSTARQDDVNAVVAGEDPRIQQALGGRTVSVLSSAGTDHEGLKRPSEELFQTFIPIRLSGASVDGVVQIDQRYDAIHNRADGLWRSVQIILLLLLVGAGVMLARTFRGGVSYGAGGPDRRQSPGRRADDLSVRDATDRADDAERRVGETERRVAELERELARAPSTATAAAAVEELDLRLRASEAEREELAGTVKRLQAELAESQAEVTLARLGTADTPAEAKRVNRLIADAEVRAVAAERKAADAERKSQDAAKRASLSAERGLELEAQLLEAQKLAADALKPAGGVDRRVADAEGQLGDALGKLHELEETRAAFQERRDEGPPLAGGFGARAEREHPLGDVRDAITTGPDSWSDSPAPPADSVEEELAEGLSLRERLARAAADRRRLS